MPCDLYQCTGAGQAVCAEAKDIPGQKQDLVNEKERKEESKKRIKYFKKESRSQGSLSIVAGDQPGRVVQATHT